MTIATSAMSLPLREQMSATTARETGTRTGEAGADAEIRRISALVAKGDETAFRQLYDLYRSRLFRFALVLARGDDALANETVQSVFLTAAGKLRAVESEEHLWNWLARVARQHLAKHWRKCHQDAPLVGMEEVPDVAASNQSDSLLEECLDTALLAVDPEERRIIEWFYLDGLSQRDIADKLGTTPKAVSSRLERTRARLRALVARRLSHET